MLFKLNYARQRTSDAYNRDTGYTGEISIVPKYIAKQTQPDSTPPSPTKLRHASELVHGNLAWSQRVHPHPASHPHPHPASHPHPHPTPSHPTPNTHPTPRWCDLA